MRDLKVLIAGAGIAGPALAFWLGRYGVRATVVEQAPQLRTGGQLVDIRGTAREVVRRTGLEATVRAARTTADGLSFVDARGRRQASVRAEGFGGDGPVTENEILRGRLSEIFHDATRDDADYVFGDRIRAVDDRPDGVLVEFEHAPAQVFDMVIGADGLHSGLRELVFGPVALRHLDMYLAFWTADNDLGLEGWSEAYSEPGRTVGARAINDDDAVMAFMAFTSAAFAYDHRDLGALKAVLRSRAAGMGWVADRLIAQIDDAPDFYFDSCSLVELAGWSRGRVGLIGDAAFCASPLSGHGTTMALVAAYVLAGEIARADGDHIGAFRAYEARLRPWITRIQRFAEGNGASMTPNTALGIAFRRYALRLQELLPVGSFLMRNEIRMSSGFTLPDYQDLVVTAVALGKDTPA